MTGVHPTPQIYYMSTSNIKPDIFNIYLYFDWCVPYPSDILYVDPV